jgi:hypothetical protein
MDSISQSLLNAAVDINPHQIRPHFLLFVHHSKGVILADEVGLGKTSKLVSSFVSIGQ